MKLKTKEKDRKAPAGQPAEKVQGPKAEKKGYTPAKTTQDWKDREAAEASPKDLSGLSNGKEMRLSTVEQEVAQSNFSKSNWSTPDWKVPGSSQLMYVSYFFPASKCIIDYPVSQEEADIKTDAFEKLKVPYVYVLAGHPLNVNKARQMLIDQGARIAA